VIDLTNSARYYDPAAFEKRGARHVKITCVGKDAPPDAVAVSRFVYEASKFLAERASEKQKGGKRGAGVILVHCTHGFNRTGAMLVHYMQRARPWPRLNENLAEFARARSAAETIHSDKGDGVSSPTRPAAPRAPCGIYKPEYIDALFDEYLERRFRTTATPPTPSWKIDDGESTAKKKRRRRRAPPTTRRRFRTPPFPRTTCSAPPTPSTCGRPRRRARRGRAATRASAPSPRTRLSARRTGGPRRGGTRTARACGTTTFWANRCSRGRRGRSARWFCGCAAVLNPRRDSPGPSP
jgi:hypothetical protein